MLPSHGFGPDCRAMNHTIDSSIRPPMMCGRCRRLTYRNWRRIFGHSWWRRSQPVVGTWSYPGVVVRRSPCIGSSIHPTMPSFGTPDTRRTCTDPHRAQPRL